HAPEGACVRLACIRHAASVRPEPGSNSSEVDGTREAKPSRHSAHRTRAGTSGYRWSSSRFSCEGASRRSGSAGEQKTRGERLGGATSAWRPVHSGEEWCVSRERSLSDQLVGSTSAWAE